MSAYPVGPGKTTIAIEVLVTIARLSALKVPGVSRMSPTPGRAVKGLFKRSQASDGVIIEVKDDMVYADLYVVLENGVNLKDVGRQIQSEVDRAITELVGMQVGRIDVHVEDIDYPQELEA
ncbi:MAG TPA: Asp23/Gls24 family envelope stress response protein [Anaerolineales bacterium]|nr:Asp23/Gls24 family envelope stress response protein [Anaerolineales bacterium]